MGGMTGDLIIDGNHSIEAAKTSETGDGPVDAIFFFISSI